VAQLIGRIMAEPVSKVRHFGGFVLAGGMAFVTDAGVTQLLTGLTSLSPLAARPLAIFLAMLVSWGLNRTITFAESRPPSWPEFAKFAAASFGSQLVNYLVFAAMLALRPATDTTLAIAVASGVAMFVAYAGFRFGVFAKSN
jgi:putative flippase GtrA